MVKVIAVAQQKGGAGKTMLAAQLGVALAETRRVALLDIDPQGSLTAWGRLRTTNPKALHSLTIETVAGWRMAATLQTLAKAHDLILIDTPPVLDADASRAIRGADLVLIPLNPTPPDLWAAEGTLALAVEERRKVALVFNRAPAASKLRRRLETEIAARRLLLLDQSLGNRAAFANAFAEGLGVVELSRPGIAGDELASLAARVLVLLG